jgi:hypothetical protein
MQLEVLERIGRDDGRFALRVRRWINDAMHEVDEMENWSYLFTSTTGVAPLTIADLGTVESVVDVGNLVPLAQIDRHSLTDTYANLANTGSISSYWYLTTPTTISTYPVSTVTLTVRYFKFGPDLAAAADAPLMPDRFRQVIVELAACKAYGDIGRPDQADACWRDVQRQLETMRLALLPMPDAQILTYGSLDA